MAIAMAAATAACLPPARGPLSEHVLALLHQDAPTRTPAVDDEPLAGDDLHLALYVCYELHYRGFAGIHPAQEWDPAVLGFRHLLEQRFLGALRDESPHDGPLHEDTATAIVALLAEPAGPSLSSHMAAHGTAEELLEFLIHRSAYQLKEADPHTWAIPRLAGSARKSALIEIQADEYGNGVPNTTHAELFTATMRDAGLDAGYGAYLDRLPGSTLATCNLVSLFGLHRELAGALLGHLAVFEMTSVVPMARYARAAQRLGFGPAVRHFFDVHVEADEHHGALAEEVLIGGDLRADGIDPADVLFGARALLRVEDRFARHLLDAWSGGETSLL